MARRGHDLVKPFRDVLGIEVREGRVEAAAELVTPR
jgi:hypothetical protein